jgi:hypothetical protein
LSELQTSAHVYKSKLDKAVVLYFPAKVLGSAVGAHCGDCWKFVEGEGGSGECQEVEGDILAAHGICGLFVNGRSEVENKISKAVAGYAETGPTHCGNCEYFGGGDAASGPCQKVAGTVEYEGCCNQWEPKEK